MKLKKRTGIIASVHSPCPSCKQLTCSASDKICTISPTAKVPWVVDESSLAADTFVLVDDKFILANASILS